MKHSQEKTTAKQNKAIALEIEHPDWSARKIAEEIGVHYITVYNWWHSDLYCNERDKQLKNTWKNSVKKAQQTMIELAEKGNYKAAEYILNSAGYTPKQFIDLTTTINDVTITIDEGE